MSFFAFAQGGPLVSPKQISGCVLWVRGDLGVTSSTTFTWADQVGGDVNKNLTATGAARPTANGNNASYNHQATIDFNGTTNFLQSGTWVTSLSQPFTEFFVGHSSSGTKVPVGSIANPEVDHYQINPSTPAIYAGTGTVSSTGSLASPAVFGAVFNGASSALYLNSHTSTGSGNPGASGRTGMMVGDYYLGPPPSADAWNGTIAEVIAYNRALTATEITRVMGYLGSRYGIAIA